MKIASLILRIAVLLLIILAILTLVIPASATLMVDVYENWGVGYESILTSSSSNSTHVNFFGNMVFLAQRGENVSSSVLLIVTLLLTALFLLLSFFLKVFRKGYFSVPAFLTAFISWWCWLSLGDWKYFEEHTSATRYLRIYYHSNIDTNLFFTLAFMFLAFVLLIVVGVLESKIRKKELRLAEIGEQDEGMGEAPEGPQFGTAPAQPQFNAAPAQNQYNSPAQPQFNAAPAQNQYNAPAQNQYNAPAPELKNGQYAPIYSDKNVLKNDQYAPIYSNQPIPGANGQYNAPAYGAPNNDKYAPIYSTPANAQAAPAYEQNSAPAQAAPAYEQNSAPAQAAPAYEQNSAPVQAAPVVNQNTAAASGRYDPTAYGRNNAADAECSSEYERVMAEIEKYQYYFEKGVINEAQYNAKKNQLMRQLQSGDNAQ